MSLSNSLSSYILKADRYLRQKDTSLSEQDITITALELSGSNTICRVEKQNKDLTASMTINIDGEDSLYEALDSLADIKKENSKENINSDSILRERVNGKTKSKSRRKRSRGGAA